MSGEAGRWLNHTRCQLKGMKQRGEREAQSLPLLLYIFRAATKRQGGQVAQTYLLPTQEQRSDEAARPAQGSITASAGPRADP